MPPKKKVAPKKTGPNQADTRLSKEIKRSYIVSSSFVKNQEAGKIYG
jgi:hypothetical protein